MAIRRVYGSLDSPNTLKVLAAMFEHDIDFEFVPIDIEAGENKRPEFLSMSPFGQIPVYEDGPIRQFECRGVVRSTAHEYAHRKPAGQEIICWEARKQALIANWIDVEDLKFEPAVLAVLNDNNPAAMADNHHHHQSAEANLCKVLDVYEAQLKKHKYLVMDKFTAADLLHLPNLQTLKDNPTTRSLVDARPRVSAWADEILTRPSWVKVVNMIKGC
uniref:glutathione transferase n=1 Tax=Limonium bicolor TaxID=293754 RepID=B9W0A4_9CARY|nr:glutathione S-transferase [Limonium bicolor]